MIGGLKFADFKHRQTAAKKKLVQVCGGGNFETG
jgi:hypothetical protein